LPACAVKAAQVVIKSPRAGKENAPGRRSPGEPGCQDAEKSASGNPNRQRDETPEARPLSAEMPHAPKARQAPLIREGPDSSVRAEESIPADDQSRGGANAVGFMSAGRGKVANRTRGKSHRENVTISVRSSFEGQSPRERTWLKRHQGVRRGSKASKHMVSARTQRDPGR
jgi:hypothetical protein